VTSHVVVGTVKKVNHMMTDGLISAKTIKTVVFDEADTLLGKTDEYNLCKNMCTARLTEAQPLFFSATFTPAIKALIETDFLAQRKTPTPLNVIQLVVEKDQEGVINRDMLFQCAVDCQQKDENGQPMGKFQALVQMYGYLSIGVSLVFVRTKADANRIAQQLFDLGNRPLLLTGDTEKSERDKLFRTFRDTEDYNVCICTDILGKGVDIPKLNMVINYDLPDEKDEATGKFRISTTAYLQRGGRSTRAGSKGILINLIDGPQDAADLQFIERHYYGDVEPNSIIKVVPQDEDGEFSLENLKSMISEFL